MNRAIARRLGKIEDALRRAAADLPAVRTAAATAPATRQAPSPGGAADTGTR